MKPKILYVGPVNFNPDSWRTRADYILPDLFSALGTEVEVHVLTGPVPDFARERLQALGQRFGLHLHELPQEQSRTGRLERWVEAVSGLALTLRPGVITNVFGSQWLGRVITTAAERAGAKSILRVAGDEIGSRVALGVYEQDALGYVGNLIDERLGFVAADTVIAMSPWEAQRIRRAIGEATDKVVVCLRGVDLQRFTPGPYSGEATPRRFLYVGRKSAEKGYDLIEAAAKKVWEIDPSIEFLFVGDFPPQRIENRSYLGWVEAADLPALYARADALVLSSRSEGFPQVVAESMAAGLPCILSEHLFGSVFAHGRDALLFPLSAQALAEQILNLANDPLLARRLARRSREIAEALLDQRAWQRRYAALLQLQPVQDQTVFDRRQAAAAAPAPLAAGGLPRVAFITPRIFGMMGTQGSYGLARAFAAVAPTLVISRQEAGATALPIVAGDDGIRRHHRIDFSSPDAGERIAALLAEFEPDIVHYVNDHSWVKVLPVLKARYPAARYVMDFKTPLLAQGAKRESLHEAAAREAPQVDLVVALSKDIAETWIPDCARPVLTYPLGIELDAIPRRTEAPGTLPGPVRFIYVGQLHPLRRIPLLLEYVAALDPGLKEHFTLDLYGAGGGEEEIDAQIERLGLGGCVTRKPPLPQPELFALMGTYDCGIAWVPREVYNEAPSLKFLEYAAAGIGVIASDTLAHRRNLEQGFDVPLFEENAESFGRAVRTAMEGQEVRQQLVRNARAVRRFGFDWIVRNVLLPEFTTLRDKPPAEAAPEAAPRRLLFVSPRPLGLMATPGTYLSVEAYAEHFEVEVVAKPVQSPDEIIVHTPPESIRTTLLDPLDAHYARDVAEVVRRFRPDIVCLGSSAGVHRLIKGLRQEFPDVPITLEVKSPMVIPSEKKRARAESEWQQVRGAVDAVIAPARGMAETFLGDMEQPFLRHRSIIDFHGIEKKTFDSPRLVCRKFVFSGSLSKLRKIDKFLKLLARVPRDVRSGITVDFFGDGPDREEFVQLHRRLGLEGCVRFLGAIPQAELFTRYREYDAGLAWVPTELFDSAPSLKLIEYCASGLAPVATASSGHLLLKEYGFQVDYFEENEQSFAQTLTRMCTEGVASAPLLENVRNAEKFDYRSVIGNEIVPFYNEICGTQDRGARERRPAGVPAAAARPVIATREGKADAARQPTSLQRNALLHERALHARRVAALRN